MAKKNSPEILTGLGVAGVFSTSYLVGKASFKASVVIDCNEGRTGINPDKKERLKERVKSTWKFYIPPAISGVATIACILGASKQGNNRTAAAVTAYSLTEKAFSEYKEKVVEELGKGKEQKIRDELKQKEVDENPVGRKEVIITGCGDVLCCELYTHRYFRSDMQALRRAENEINAKINNNLYVALDEFYDLVGLSHTSLSAFMGWNSDRLMELEFTTTLSEDGEPCLAFDYNYTKPL